MAGRLAGRRRRPHESSCTTLTTGLGGLTQTLGEATPPEKASIYQGLGSTAVQPDEQATTLHSPT
jgi:hypothetical protein